MISCRDILAKETIEVLEEFKDLSVRSLNTLKDANQDDLTFVESDKFIEELKNTKAGAVFVRPHLREYIPKETTPILVNHPYLTLAKISQYFTSPLIINEEEAKIGENCKIMPNVFIGSNTTIGENTTIMPGAYIGNNVTIGSNTIIYPNVVIYDKTILENNVIIHGGAAIGVDGFGYVQDKEFNHHKIHHTGNVHIQSDVEVGANTTIDRAVFGTTIIKQGSKIDNLVQIAHNCEIGEKCAIAGQTGIAGSSIIGDKVLFGAQAGVAGHLKIGNSAIIAARGGVTKSIDGGKVYAGFPLYESKKWLKIQSKVSRLVGK